MVKYKVKIREVIEHEYEVEEVNIYMAKEAARHLLKKEQGNRVYHDTKDIVVEEVK
ncbi:hypothetical protein LCGC14_0374100 [marine sediment metagenome]|uniref:Uncharacterized protein n=1 Tax=marine sediment metagenome TaxID=412755 RepID=A0A0F9T438_9ZZZZ